MGSLQQRVTVTSNALSKASIYLPFIAVVAFIFQQPVLSIVDPLFFRHTEISHFAILQHQYEFLSEKLTNPAQEYTAKVGGGPFHLFELFIWTAPTIGLLRFLTGVSSSAVRESSIAKLQAADSQGWSPFVMFFCLLVCAPLGVLLSLNFHLNSDSVSLGALMIYAPRAYVCAATFMFCGSVAFAAEGLLLLFSLIF
jgi:hypothetical protein